MRPCAIGLGLTVDRLLRMIISCIFLQWVRRIMLPLPLDIIFYVSLFIVTAVQHFIELTDYPIYSPSQLSPESSPNLYLYFSPQNEYISALWSFQPEPPSEAEALRETSLLNSYAYPKLPKCVHIYVSMNETESVFKFSKAKSAIAEYQLFSEGSSGIEYWPPLHRRFPAGSRGRRNEQKYYERD